MSIAAEATAVAVTTNKEGFWVDSSHFPSTGSVSASSRTHHGCISNDLNGHEPDLASISTRIGDAYFRYCWSAHGGGQTVATLFALRRRER